MKNDRELLLQEIHHRVKNNLQILESLLHLQVNKFHDNKCLEMLRGYTRRIHAIAAVESIVFDEQSFDAIDIGSCIQNVINYLKCQMKPSSRKIDFIYEIEPIMLTISQAIPCALIINENISNALMHAFPDQREGTIGVRFRRLDDQGALMLHLWDNGVGMPPGSGTDRTKTLGLELVEILTGQLRGKLAIAGDQGAAITITFPSLP
jgi:two-component sensor histidine kinase